MRSTSHVVKGENDAGRGYYSDPPLLVLASLANGPKHGHAMIEDIANLSGTRLGPGTLYGAIARLEQQGWIEPLPAEERRQPYRITGEGLRVLRAKLTTSNNSPTLGWEGWKRYEPQTRSPPDVFVSAYLERALRGGVRGASSNQSWWPSHVGKRRLVGTL